MAAAAVLPPVAMTSSATEVVKNDVAVRRKDTDRVSILTNRLINPQKPPKVDIYWCEPCKMKLTNPLASLKHFTGHDHLAAVNRAIAAKKTTQTSKKVGAQSSDLKRKQDPKVSAPPAKIAKGNAASASAGAGAAAAKKKPAATPPSKTNTSNRGAKRGGGAFNNRNSFNNNNASNQRSNFNNGSFNNRRANTFQSNNNQRNGNFNSNNNNQPRNSNFNSNNNNQRNLALGGFNLSRNDQVDTSYLQSYIRDSAGMNRNMGGNNSFTWQQQQQEINNMLAQQQLNTLQHEVSNLEMLQQRLMRAENHSSLLRGNNNSSNNNNNNNRGGLLRGDSFGGNRSGRDGFWGR